MILGRYGAIEIVWRCRNCIIIIIITSSTL